MCIRDSTYCARLSLLVGSYQIMSAPPYNSFTSERRKVASVSYTHLDVYKRQVPIHTSPVVVLQMVKASLATMEFSLSPLA